ncbi:MAG: hypothetical protein JXK94_10415 [Deltaproteobacteria bacterium]|nr:hypothetical protein [Deltaproteobacteria bacterium]
MTRDTDTGQTPHPNPFTLAKIQRFYRHKGIPVEIKGGHNMYILSKGGNLWFRIVYLQDQNEWFLDSWQPDSMVVTYWQQKRPHLMRRNCWYRVENRLPQLDLALEATLDLLE